MSVFLGNFGERTSRCVCLNTGEIAKNPCNMDGFFLSACKLAFYLFSSSFRKKRGRENVETRFVRTTTSFSIRTKKIPHTSQTMVT